MDRRSKRVMVADNSPEHVERLRDNLRTEGYAVETSLGFGDALRESVVRVAREFRPHVSILDLRTGGPVELDEIRDDDYTGLEIAQQMPCSCRIVTSEYYSVNDSNKVHDAKFIPFDTLESSPEDLLQIVSREMKKLSAAHRGFQVYWPSGLTSRDVVRALLGRKARLRADLVDDVLAQLFIGEDEITLAQMDLAAGTPPSVTRGRSMLFAVELPGREVSVLKLAPAPSIVREDKNFEAFIERRLAGDLTAIKMSCACFWDLGAIVYHLIPGETFAAIYPGSDSARLLRLLGGFFRKTWNRHYMDPKALTSLRGSIYESWDQAAKLGEKLSRFRNKKKHLSFLGLPGNFVNPVEWVLAHREDSRIADARCAVTHGDLHGNNLMLKGEQLWVIDFERTGPGHMLRDFNELEVDIVTRLANARDLVWFHEFARVLTSPYTAVDDLRPTAAVRTDGEARKGLEVVAGLRRLAQDRTSFTDFREYVWGLLCDAVFVAASVEEDSPQRQKALLYGALLCERLRHWGHPLPDPSGCGDSYPGPCPNSSSPDPQFVAARSDAFLSYNRRDRAVVEQISAQLVAAGLQLWRDESALAPGDEWLPALDRALAACPVCVIFLGAEGLGQWQRQEVQTALGRRVTERSYRLIPVLLPGCPDIRQVELFSFLSHFCWVDFREGMSVAPLQELSAAIRAARQGYSPAAEERRS